MSQARRRQFLFVAALLLFASLGAAPAGAAPPVVGVLALGSPDISLKVWERTLVVGLRKLGYKDGESILIEYRWAHGDIARYPKLAQELMERRPAVIVTPCGASVRAIRQISRTQPVIATCADMNNFFGEIASLARPGGFTTGITYLSPESVGKRLELLREVLPGFSRLAVLDQADETIAETWSELKRLEPIVGMALQRVQINHVEELEAAFESFERERAQAVYVFPTHLMLGQRGRVAELALKHHLATISEFSVNVESGGLMSYGASESERMGKTLPMYVDKILRGAQPGELPIMQPTEFELVVNLRTARALGLTVPKSLLSRADRVIE